jgi:hypothetical protein
VACPMLLKWEMLYVTLETLSVNMEHFHLEHGCPESETFVADSYKMCVDSVCKLFDIT